MINSVYIDKYMNGLVKMFVGEVVVPHGYIDPPDKVLSKSEEEARNKERVLNRTEYCTRLNLFKKGDYSVAKEPFRGKITDPSAVSSLKRRGYLERLYLLKNQRHMILKGNDVRWTALEKLRKKVNEEFTLQMTRKVIHGNIARTRKAQARRKKKPNN